MEYFIIKSLTFAENIDVGLLLDVGLRRKFITTSVQTEHRVLTMKDYQRPDAVSEFTRSVLVLRLS